MAIIITDECINCGACEPECPNNAIYEGGVEWAISDGNTVTGAYALEDGTVVDAAKKLSPVSNDYYYIVPDKCTECVGFHEEPQCAAVCPVDCCVPDPDHVESKELLLDRKVIAFMKRYAIVQDIVTRLTDNPTFRTFFTLYLMADSDTERTAFDARFWGDASILDAGKQQALRAELTRTFLRLPVLINQLHEKATVAMV